MNNPFDTELDPAIIAHTNADQDKAAAQLVDARRGLALAFDKIARGRFVPLAETLHLIPAEQLQALMDIATKSRPYPVTRSLRRRAANLAAVGKDRLAAFAEALGNDDETAAIMVEALVGHGLLTALAEAHFELGDIAAAISELSDPLPGAVS